MGLDSTLFLQPSGFWGWSLHRAVLGGHASLPVGSLSTFKSGWQKVDVPQDCLAALGLPSFFLPEFAWVKKFWLCRNRKENMVMKPDTVERANST